MNISARARMPTVSSADRLSVTLLLAALLHAVAVFGISFDFLDRVHPEDVVQKIEVTLVNTPSDEAPEHADYLAQANAEGAGNVQEPVRPSAPRTGSAATTDLVPGPEVERRITPPAQPTEPTPLPEQLTQSSSPQKVPTQPRETPKKREKKPTAAELITRSMEIASLDAEIRERRQAYASRPRTKYISASTREYKYATYMEAWRKKVERIGRLNYPDEAKRRKLSGSLLLDVALNPDGSIRDIELRRSSGIKVLDDAAVRIVKLSAPFAPFPEDIQKETDVLHIQRTWIFQSSNQLVAR